MLKRLELVGFKSFAEKTSFEFAPGVTGIIGPNGSGKSNVVDAVRWVLGEQSARSLRGGEMTDVIFNGSASRRSLGLAEVTMIFENTRRSLNTEADEVQITRRVYRSGEGEYLINGQLARLKDIKDLFLGSGAGVDAYSIIEQGRVDILLQSSAKERRLIFEEAAGISRFKARKAETLRRLERVDANLTRLRDILEEVEKQLRSVKLQAAKAQRYQEYHGRLRTLRVALSLREYHGLAAHLNKEQLLLQELRVGLDEETSQADSWEQRLVQLEGELVQIESVVRLHEAARASARQQIASAEATLGAGWAAAREIDGDLNATRQRLIELIRHTARLSASCQQASAELKQAEEDATRRTAEAEGLAEQLGLTETRLAELREQTNQDKEAHLEAMRLAGRKHNDTSSYRAQVDNLTRERGRLRLRSEQAAEHLASVDVELEELNSAEQALLGRVTSARERLDEVLSERDRLAALRESTTQSLADLRAERTGVLSRIEVLEGLERTHEGLGTGARELYALLEAPDPGPWSTVVGIVAEFLTVRREYAPLIDLALGERAQRFLVRDVGQLALALRQRQEPFSGRVSFLPLNSSFASTPILNGKSEDAGPSVRIPEAALRQGPTAALLGIPGVVALADQVVRCDDPSLVDLPTRLLGKTLIVRDLASAWTAVSSGVGVRCITLQGELLEEDGTLTLGRHHAETGILSRKSELRDLREQVNELELRLRELDGEVAGLREKVGVLDGRIDHGRREIEVLTEQANDMRWRIGQHQQRRAGLSEEVQVSQSEMSGLESEIERVQSSWREALQGAQDADRQVQLIQTRMEEAEREARQREGQRGREQQEALAARVALAQVEERLTGLRTRQSQLDDDVHQRKQEYAQAEARLSTGLARQEDNNRALLEASTSQALAYRDKESAEEVLTEQLQRRDLLQGQRQGLNELANQVRNHWRARQEAIHGHELTVNDLRHKLDALAARLREDYDLELAELYANWQNSIGAERLEAEVGLEPAIPPSGSGEDNLPPEEEIVELRRRLSKLGHVNLEAIVELAELEGRHDALRYQFGDLSAAQKQLQDIIDRINGDSRRLFLETFTTIRGHFQELFRKLFGGGQADALLEEGVDVLESGIEIMARPPGKELRNISLMSGGEKTMTAVALLLAIFQSKPSPFCILDEVDAALDEANVGRFTAVLREFLDRSQFILITHSKRTMACADVLYGVTMQESGVSRRFSVRFEDWEENGAASSTAVANGEQTQPVAA